MKRPHIGQLCTYHGEEAEIRALYPGAFNVLCAVIRYIGLDKDSYAGPVSELEFE